MGAHVPTLVRAPAAAITSKILNLFILVIVVVLSCINMSAFGGMDADALLNFKASLTIAKSLSNWDPSVNPCSGNNGNWVGVICFQDNIWGLRLENMGLMGRIDVDPLVTLPYLRTLSVMNNTFSGPFPDLNKLSKLKSVFLSYNHFTGEIPSDAFSGMNSLKKVLLSNNEFSGKIPSSLTGLPKLMVLDLEGNKFKGQIPHFQQTSLNKLNLAYNELEGPIPASLSKMDPSSFEGNTYLCGPPLASCSTPRVRKKAPVLKIVLIVLVIVLILALIAAAVLIFHLRSKQSSASRQQQPRTTYDQVIYGNRGEHDQYRHHKVPEHRGKHGKRGEHGKLAFVRDDRDKFDLQDLLRASAEILGSATFGSSYKAVMMDGQAIVVKRYKQMNNVEREDFHEHMRRLGCLNHPNLLPLVAYYYRKEEKLLLSDFVENGCLASQLHGNHNLDQPGLDWPTRLRIVKGVVKGLAYLCKALPSLVAPHGHLKSSNVLLDESFEPLLTDYALIPVINLDHAQMLMMAYKSPEYAEQGRITKKTDIWSLGILILEILTGKFPENYMTQRHNSDADIASWVNEMIKEKRISEVFDVDMGGVGSSKGELLKLLKIGLSCCEADVERRLDLKDVVEQIEELKEGEIDEPGEYSSSVTCKGDGYSSRAV
ncbi:putative Receptor protein kinase [Quillaja saponaria]|uniref:non-specific serine/threonine protein kinase n=1 Tax=Quillaja saponaria TaxID=32244 RepID=A0AAD7LT84_QUISA|nr:putative Receptor protein kinase [Quillaja saponaria]